MLPRFAIAIALAASIPLLGHAEGLSNGAYRLTLSPDGKVLVDGGHGATAIFSGRFALLYSASDPDLEILWGQFSDPGLRSADTGSDYNVLTWGKKLEPVAAREHLADGFDAATDRSYGVDRRANLFAAGSLRILVASGAHREGDRVVWTFPADDRVAFSAYLELPPSGPPLVRFSAVPKSAGWYSVGYLGAPSFDREKLNSDWQPLIYDEKRFPEDSFLEPAYRCPLPGTLVSLASMTLGVFADPAEYPFEPMPTAQNSRFGVALRTRSGQAEPMVFAPILGGTGSKRAQGDAFGFTLRLIVSPADLSSTYEAIARQLFDFADVRHNALGSLNTTFENMVEFGLSDYARFNEELRGFAYDTDVPGSVKNISALHPLSIALVTDDRRIYDRLARPIMEYFISRGRYLFATDAHVKGQGASSRLDGFGASISEFTALYEMSGRRTPVFLQAAESLYGKPRSLNLDAATTNDSWADALALYQATGDRSWLERAVKGADEYLSSRGNRPQVDFDDATSGGMFFWTGFVPRWMQLYELFEETHEERFLAAAHAGAREYTQFVWLSPRIPAGEVMVNLGGIAPAYRPALPRIRLPEEKVPAWRVSEIGLTAEAAPTSKGARGIFLACYAPWMLRIAALTGDSFLHDIARSAIVGRYTSFPGYHMNTARTTVYEKPDFARRPMAQLNSTTSLHYNHIWPQIALIQDYLVADAFAKSNGKIDFPDRYAEGYGYVQEQIYGDRPGHFYDSKPVFLWMPKGLVKTDNPELNYIAARGEDRLAVAFTNQSAESVSASIIFDRSRLCWPASSRPVVEVWEQNRLQGTHPLAEDGKERIDVGPAGITALILNGVVARAEFQPLVFGKSPALPRGSVCDLGYRGARAAAISFGSQLTSVYCYLPDFDREIARCTLRYHQGAGAEAVQVKSDFPFDFTILSRTGEAVDFFFEVELKDGRRERSPNGKVQLQ